MQNKFLERIQPYLNLYSELSPIATNVASSIQNNAGIEAIVFDIYGTLIISASGDLDKSTVKIGHLTQALIEGGYTWKTVANESKYGNDLLGLFHSAVNNQHKQLKKHGHPFPEVDIIKVWGKVLKEAVENNWLIPSDNTCIKTLTVVFEILSNPVWPMPNMLEVISALNEKNVPIGIVSNAQFYTPIIMNSFMSNILSEQEHIEKFDHDISVFSYKLLRSKPDTYLYKQLAEKLDKKYNLKPEQVLFVGNDMLKDVWTARLVGFKTALFAGDQRSLRLRSDDKRCEGLTPDIIINNLSELLELI
ncbi:MAG: HAD family hydrolase [Salinivirgaceae bacterium]|jgi:putative hydrolase of the HAD superfamily|nr:HAD family hydrolase [Salinivirgaceae bacterium]